jgi:hypothetical protein
MAVMAAVVREVSLAGSIAGARVAINATTRRTASAERTWQAVRCIDGGSKTGMNRMIADN